MRRLFVIGIALLLFGCYESDNIESVPGGTKNGFTAQEGTVLNHKVILQNILGAAKARLLVDAADGSSFYSLNDFDAKAIDWNCYQLYVNANSDRVLSVLADEPESEAFCRYSVIFVFDGFTMDIRSVYYMKMIPDEEYYARHKNRKYTDFTGQVEVYDGSGELIDVSDFIDGVRQVGESTKADIDTIVVYSDTKAFQCSVCGHYNYFYYKLSRPRICNYCGHNYDESDFYDEDPGSNNNSNPDLEPGGGGMIDKNFKSDNQISNSRLYTNNSSIRSTIERIMKDCFVNRLINSISSRIYITKENTGSKSKIYVEKGIPKKIAVQDTEDPYLDAILIEELVHAYQWKNNPNYDKCALNCEIEAKAAWCAYYIKWGRDEQLVSIFKSRDRANLFISIISDDPIGSNPRKYDAAIQILRNNPTYADRQKYPESDAYRNFDNIVKLDYNCK